MITVLLYLVIAAVIGVVVFFLAVVVFGRGEQMAPLDPRTAPAELPEAGIGPDDVTALRFSMALRGYRMSDVDWALARLGQELDALRGENDTLRRRLVEIDPVHPLAGTGTGTGTNPDDSTGPVIAPEPIRTGDLEPAGSTGPEVSR